MLRKLKKPKDKDAEERLKILIHERDVATRGRVNRLDTEQLKSLLDCLMKRQPGFVFDPVQNLEFYIVEGGQVIPASIKVENYDASKILVIWNGSPRKKIVKMCQNDYNE